MIWLIGAGPMAHAYTKVLSAQGREFTVCGRSEASARSFGEATGITPTTGGVRAMIAGGAPVPEAAIIAVGVDQLFDVARQCIAYGIPRILLEKPGALAATELATLRDEANAANTEIVIGYNRRFYASVRQAKQFIEADGKVTSFSFQITERSHIIRSHQKPTRVMHNWFIANTSHVVDLAWYLGGPPETLTTYHSGALDWHPSSSVFSGAGKTKDAALFSYHGDWNSAGGWSLELMTPFRRLLFKPLEKLQVQVVGSNEAIEVEAADQWDELFKPGLYLQVQDFLDGNDERFCTLEQQMFAWGIYEQMAGYR